MGRPQTCVSNLIDSSTGFTRIGADLQGDNTFDDIIDVDFEVVTEAKAVSHAVEAYR